MMFSFWIIRIAQLISLRYQFNTRFIQSKADTEKEIAAPSTARQAKRNISKYFQQQTLYSQKFDYPLFGAENGLNRPLQMDAQLPRVLGVENR
jgi:hypothetical protein